MIRKIAVRIILTLVMCTTVYAAGQGEGASLDFPNRQIQVIFPWNPSTTYAVSQIVAKGMSKHLGENVVVTSTPGASGVKAAKTVMASQADGYTIFDGFIAPQLLVQLKGEDVGFDYSDFKPLYGAFANYFTIVIRNDETRYSDIQSMLEYIKANPGELRYSSGGDVSIPHMGIASTLQASEAVARYIPFNSSNEGVKNLLSGDVDFAVINAGVYHSFKDQVKNLGVLADAPQPAFQGTPAITDLGIPLGLTGVGAAGWTWWVVHKDTPDEVVAVLRDAMKKALSDKEVVQKINELNYSVLDPELYSPDRYTEVYETLAEQFTNAIQALNWEREKIKELDAN